MVRVTEPSDKVYAGPSTREDRHEGDRALVPEILREVHHGHAAAAELALDRVAVG
jgi:hypothetical protein